MSGLSISPFIYLFGFLALIYVVSDIPIPRWTLSFWDSVEGGIFLSALTLALFCFEGIFAGIAMFVLSYVLVVRSAEERTTKTGKI